MRLLLRVVRFDRRPVAAAATTVVAAATTAAAAADSGTASYLDSIATIDATVDTMGTWARIAGGSSLARDLLDVAMTKIEIFIIKGMPIAFSIDTLVYSTCIRTLRVEGVGIAVRMAIVLLPSPDV